MNKIKMLESCINRLEEIGVHQSGFYNISSNADLVSLQGSYQSRVVCLLRTHIGKTKINGVDDSGMFIIEGKLKVESGISVDIRVCLT